MTSHACRKPYLSVVRVRALNQTKAHARGSHTRLVDLVHITRALRIQLFREGPAVVDQREAARLRRGDVRQSLGVDLVVVRLDAVRVVDGELDETVDLRLQVDGAVTNTQRAEVELRGVGVRGLAVLDQLVLVDEVREESSAPESSVLDESMSMHIVKSGGVYIQRHPTRRSRRS